MNTTVYLVLAFSIGALSLFTLTVPPNHIVKAECDLPGTSHGDNNPSENKGDKMLEQGASACEIAKACDAMKIDVSIKNEEHLKDTPMYQIAPDEIQEELEEYAQDGSGHDNPDIVCYEVEDAVKGD